MESQTDLEDAEIFLDQLDQLEASGAIADPAALREALERLYALPDVDATDDDLQIMTVELGEVIATTCLDNARDMEQPDSVNEVVFRVLECSAADHDPNRGRQFAAKHLEALSFTIQKPELLSLLESLLDSLKGVDIPMAKFIGRALQGARLGAARS